MDRHAEAEFREFMLGRWAKLVRFGYGLTGDQGMAEDLAQTALAKAYASWPRVSRAHDPDAYVRKIMLNANRSRFRKRRVPEQLTDIVPVPAMVDGTDRNDDRSALLAALLTLPHGQPGQAARGPGRRPEVLRAGHPRGPPDPAVVCAQRVRPAGRQRDRGARGGPARILTLPAAPGSLPGGSLRL